VLDAAIIHRALAHPGIEDGAHCDLQLLQRFLREFATELLHIDLLEARHEFLEVRSGHIGILGDLQLRLEAVHHMVESLVINAHGGMPKHCQQAAIAVPHKAVVTGQRNQAGGDLVVQADVEDGIHHAGHGELGA